MTAQQNTYFLLSDQCTHRTYVRGRRRHQFSQSLQFDHLSLVWRLHVVGVVDWQRMPQPLVNTCNSPSPSSRSCIVTESKTDNQPVSQPTGLC